MRLQQGFRAEILQQVSFDGQVAAVTGPEVREYRIGGAVVFIQEARGECRRVVLPGQLGSPVDGAQPDPLFATPPPIRATAGSRAADRSVSLILKARAGEPGSRASWLKVMVPARPGRVREM